LDFIEITINNWEKYNARSDVRKSWWFKLSNDICNDPDMRHLSNAQFRVWVYLLSMSSKTANARLRVYFKDVWTLTKLNRKKTLSLFKHLENIKIISVTDSARLWNVNVAPEERRGEKRREEERRTKLATNLKNEKPLPVTRLDKPDANLLIAFYCDLFIKKNSINPVITGKDAGILKRFVKEVGLAKAKEMLVAYFSMPDAFVVEKAYAVELFVSKRNEIQRFISSGKVVTRSEAQKADKTVGAKQKWHNEEQQFLAEAVNQGLFDKPDVLIGDEQ